MNAIVSDPTSKDYRKETDPYYRQTGEIRAYIDPLDTAIKGGVCSCIFLYADGNIDGQNREYNSEGDLTDYIESVVRETQDREIKALAGFVTEQGHKRPGYREQLDSLYANQECTNCDENGEVLRQCGTCKGSGIVGKEKCSTCKGEGHMGNVECPLCKGTKTHKILVGDQREVNTLQKKIAKLESGKCYAYQRSKVGLFRNIEEYNAGRLGGEGEFFNPDECLIVAFPDEEFVNQLNKDDTKTYEKMMQMFAEKYPRERPRPLRVQEMECRPFDGKRRVRLPKWVIIE
jgi:hypothetical protein